MPTDATEGYGSTLAYSELGVTFTEVAQTVDLTGPEPEVGEVNITNNDSPDNTKEYLPGMIEPGEMSFDVVYKKSACAALYAMFGDGKTYFWRETFPDGSMWEFKGFLNSFGTEAPTEDDKMTNTIGLKLTNKPTFTPAA